MASPLARRVAARWTASQRTAAVPGGMGKPERSTDPIDETLYDDRQFDYNLLSTLREARLGGWTEKEVVKRIGELWSEEVEDYWDEMTLGQRRERQAANRGPRGVRRGMTDYEPLFREYLQKAVDGYDEVSPAGFRAFLLKAGHAAPATFDEADELFEDLRMKVDDFDLDQRDADSWSVTKA